MNKQLRILYVEDSVIDAELVVRELIRAGFEPSYHIVATESEFLAGLETFPDLILSDYSLPQFDGMRALALLIERKLDIPFMLISGTLGEEAAVTAIKQGAADYLMKDRLSRLGSAVERALQEQTLRAERKQAEAVLQQREDCLRIVSNCARIGLVVIDDEYRFVFTNTAFTEVFSLRNFDILGMHFSGVFPTIYEEQLRPRLEKAFAGERVEYELRLPKPEGLFQYAVNCEPVWEGDAVTSVVVVVVDITARRNTEELLRQSQKMEAVGQLAGGIAHDFNNLLTVISGYSSLLLQNRGLSMDERQYVTEICTASERAADLTRRLLAFSRRQMRSPEAFDLNELIRETQKLLERTIGKEVDIVLSLEPNLRPVWMDRGEMTQILLNLSLNARDAMLNRGRLEIQTQNHEVVEGDTKGSPSLKQGKYTLLTVSDSGCGMPEELQQKIFEPFFTTKPVGKGTGLGLAIVHGIVASSGGTVQVSSTFGVGTTFRIYFPQPSHSNEMTGMPAKTQRPRGGKEWILLVDDDGTVRQLTRSILVDYGYTIVEAENGEMAIQSFLDCLHPIQLLITDLIMPNMSGQQLVEKLGKLQPGIPSLCISGCILEDETRKLLSGQNVSLLQKPFQPESLAIKVREMLDLHDKQQNVAANHPQQYG